MDKLDYTVYVVGGFVRDLLIDQPRPAHQEPDVDIVLEGDAIQFAEHMRAEFGGRVVPHQRFNTAKWLLDDPDYPAQTGKLMDAPWFYRRSVIAAHPSRLRVCPN